jgi:hypothetical protein
MTLEELAAAAPRSSPAPVPAWSLGCFERRSVTYANGAEDQAGRAIWMQVQGLAADLYVPAWRPDVSARQGLHECSVEELLDLAAVEGGVADASWGNGAMSYDNPSAFQPHEPWPEPGLLQRVGPALIEFAPSGAYVEDWRLQPGCSGLMVGLRLMFETGLDGLTRPRDGGLLICGDHCLFSLDRHRPLPGNTPAQQQMRAAGDPYAFADMVFDGETSYARRQPDGSFKIELSTHPFREGGDVPISDGFCHTSITAILRQHIGEGDQRIIRQWRIDTLIASAEIVPATEPDKTGAAWLKREAKTLLRGL